MSKINIISKTIASIATTQIDARIINMPLYPTTLPEVQVFYGYIKSDNKRIEDATAEGNSTLGDLISSSSKTALLTALTNITGAVTSAVLNFNQLNDNRYTVSYVQGGVQNTIILTGNFFTTAEYSAVKNEIVSQTASTLDEFLVTKTLTVNSTASQSDYPIQITIHSGTGTDTVTDVYVGTVRSDWGDIRVQYNGVAIPFAILNNSGTSILISFTANLASGDNIFVIKASKVAVFAPYKIACLTDTHYDPNDTYEDRNQTLNFIDNFVARMATYLPDLAVNNGDKIGESNNNIANETTRLAWYQSNMDHFAPVSAYATTVRDGVAMGNHDNEAFNWTNVLAKHSSETWMQPGVMYGYWESADFRFISLDDNYDSATQAHVNNLNTLYAYIDDTQMSWLTATLAASTKPCIIFVHHCCGELDTDIILLNKEIYHLSNRVALRNVLEASGKVACVIHGHLHWHRHDIINGIPYLVMTNSATEAQPFSNPTNTLGRWYLIEIDREACKIKFTLETKIGASYYTIYEDTVAYKTIFNDDIAHSAERVFALTNNATYSHASLWSDPAQVYSTNVSNIAFMPVNKYLGEPYISDRTIKIIGRNDSPNIGKGKFYFANQTGLFRIRFGLYALQLKTLNFKFGNGANADTAPSIVFSLNTDGSLSAYNGATSTSAGTYSITTWYQFEIIANTAASTFTVKKDGTAIATNFAFKGANTQLNQLQIETETGTWYIDNLRATHYASPEPSITSVV
jgi:hypothetical protein